MVLWCCRGFVTKIFFLFSLFSASRRKPRLGILGFSENPKKKPRNRQKNPWNRVFFGELSSIQRHIHKKISRCTCAPQNAHLYFSTLDLFEYDRLPGIGTRKETIPQRVPLGPLERGDYPPSLSQNTLV